ncbi:DNA-directed RNA polymerase subunit beta [Dirofilaria immitis]
MLEHIYRNQLLEESVATTQCPNRRNLKTRVIGTKKLMMDNQDNEALNAFQKFITHDKEGRYVVSWPWKSNDVVPAKGYSLALGRNLFQEGIIEKVKKEESKERVAYLPHQAMINP